MKIEDLLAHQAAAATRQDAEATVAYFDEPFVVVRDGGTEVFINRHQILDRVRAAYVAYKAAGVASVEYTLMDLTPIAENSALVHARVHTSMADGGSFFVDDYIIARFRDGDVRIAGTITSRSPHYLDDLALGAETEDRRASPKRGKRE